MSKTAFRCSGVIGTYEWVVMPFGLKNVGATYQRAINTIFHDLIDKTMEVYINNVVVKFITVETHLSNLKQSFNKMRKHGLKMNPLKCAFGIYACSFLGFLMHKKGIEVNKNKAKAVLEASPLMNIKQF